MSVNHKHINDFSPSYSGLAGQELKFPSLPRVRERDENLVNKPPVRSPGLVLLLHFVPRIISSSLHNSVQAVTHRVLLGSTGFY